MCHSQQAANFCCGGWSRKIHDIFNSRGVRGYAVSREDTPKEREPVFAEFALLLVVGQAFFFGSLEHHSDVLIVLLYLAKDKDIIADIDHPTAVIKCFIEYILEYLCCTGDSKVKVSEAQKGPSGTSSS